MTDAPARGRTFAQRLTCRQERRRHGDARVSVVHQVHRKDRLAVLRHGDGERIFVRFKDLREKWEQVS